MTTTWHEIALAPRDGSCVWAGVAQEVFGRLEVALPVEQRFLDGKWCAWFGHRWAPVDPQPTHWSDRNQERPIGVMGQFWLLQRPAFKVFMT